MNKMTMLGLGFLIASGLLVGYQALSSMMVAGEIVWQEMTLIDAVGTDHFGWVDGISLGMVKNAVSYVIHLPLYIVLAALGLISLLIGGLTSK